jgi:hypothetical protein
VLIIWTAISEGAVTSLSSRASGVASSYRIRFEFILAHVAEIKVLAGLRGDQWAPRCGTPFWQRHALSGQFQLICLR